jgi:phosphoribosylglycinamide formyltransferase 1
MKRIVFLGSGGGGNLKFIDKYSRQYGNLFKVVSVITDRECGASDYAFRKGLPCEIMSFKRDEKEDNRLIESIKSFRPDYIITNIHKILSERIVSEFFQKLFNLHYSYLPAFGGLIGMNPVDKALERNNLFIGCTMHYVENNVDTGSTISQGIVIYKESKDVYQSVFECGSLTLLSGLHILTGYDESNFIKINDYLISPFTEKIDVNLAQNILIKLQNEQ